MMKGKKGKASKKLDMQERKLNIPPESPLIALGLERQDSSNIFNDGDLTGPINLKKTQSQHDSIVSGSKGKVSATSVQRMAS
jgi:hypothetical protein